MEKLLLSVLLSRRVIMSLAELDGSSQSLPVLMDLWKTSPLGTVVFSIPYCAVVPVLGNMCGLCTRQYILVLIRKPVRLLEYQGDDSNGVTTKTAGKNGVTSL